MKYCINCGAALPDEARFCFQCGARQGGAAVSTGAAAFADPVRNEAAASVNAALDAAAVMGEAMERGGGLDAPPPAPNAAQTAVLPQLAANDALSALKTRNTDTVPSAPVARNTDTVPSAPVARNTDTVPPTPVARNAPPVSAPSPAARSVPLYDRGALNRSQSRGRRILVDILLVIALVALQVGLILFFSGFSDDEGTDMLTAQIVGVVPVVLLLLYIFLLDTIEKEPLGLLLKLFILEGAFGMTVVVLAEVGLEAFFSGLFAEYLFTPAYRLFEAVFLVALVEELGKYIVLKRCTWKHPAFNYRFDGIVYAAVTALGFAAFENMAYVADSGLSVALIRAVSAVPGHCVDGILMGIFYGQAKWFAARGDNGKARLYRFLSVAVPVAEHGFYDFVAGIGSDMVYTLFLCYVWLLNAVVFVAVWRQSQRDEAVAGTV